MEKRERQKAIQLVRYERMKFVTTFSTLHRIGYRLLTMLQLCMIPIQVGDKFLNNTEGSGLHKQ